MKLAFKNIVSQDSPIRNLRFIFQGLVTYIPFKLPNWVWQHQPQFTQNFVRQYNDYRGLALARYSTWLRFVSRIKSKIQSGNTEVFAEIGPGDCLGIGLCALLSGFNKYYAIDKYDRIRNCDNLKLFEELLILFKEKRAIPGEDQVSGIYPSVVSHEFPLSQDVINHSLQPERLKIIRELIKKIDWGAVYAEESDFLIAYESPPSQKNADLVVSVAVMEHVEDPEQTYLLTSQILRPNGIFVHNIDLRAHGTAGLWNGHWLYSKFVWRLIRGRTNYLINRWPLSWHIRSLRNIGFEIFDYETIHAENKISSNQLASAFSDITQEDLKTESVFVSGVKIST